MIELEQVIQDVAATVVKASSHWREDQLACWKCAAEKETQPIAKWSMETFLRNAQAADEHHSALCDDTGTPHPFLEIGDDAVLPPGFLQAMEAGIRKGLNDTPTRPMGVKGNDWERISQCKGLYEEPGMLMPAPTQIRRIPGSKIRLTILMLGGGPEIRSKTQPIFHMHSLDHVVDEMIQWAIPQVRALGCQPCTLSFGLGRTACEASSLSLEAMKEGRYDVQNEIEKRITDAVNTANIGPIGLGGKTSVLATFIKVGNMRASGFRVVSMRPNCCMEIRKATCEWETKE
ncbi:MAG: fumarate hydratase [Faecousia sp.]